MKIKVILVLMVLFTLPASYLSAQNFLSATASVNQAGVVKSYDGNKKTGWLLKAPDLKSDQFIMFVLATPGDVHEVQLSAEGLSAKNLKELVKLYLTYDPMNLGEPVDYAVKGNNDIVLSFKPKYGAHLRIEFSGRVASSAISLNEVDVNFKKGEVLESDKEQPWMDPGLPIKERVDLLMNAMTPTDKMELLREGWGIPGISHLGIPSITKVEAIHGFSYGSGATIFPQSIGLAATWDKELVEQLAETIGDETRSANTLIAWSPVLDVAQDARWGRCEETYGEDPVLVSEIGGAWIKGFQSNGLIATPKHFAAHGAPLGGRDSHDIGLSEREMREIHLVPFRHAIKNYNCQSVMQSYGDYLGEPAAKSEELLRHILREEWGFDGIIVSDCGSIRNLTDKKHYTAINAVEAANQALAAGVGTNCGNVYNDKEVIAAANDGRLNQENLDNVCRTILRTMFRNGLFEDNPGWHRCYAGLPKII